MKKLLQMLTLLTVAYSAASIVQAAPIPSGWTCVGNCGSGVADGVVTTPPVGTGYQYVSSNGGTSGAGQLSVGGTIGSSLQSASFAGTAGTNLSFSFNYVTSDGAGYADYAWAKLLNITNSTETLLFTARTQSSGNIVPGFGLPATAAGVTLGTSAIISGGPSWSPLGGSSGACYSSGCGYTGWVSSLFTLTATGNYALSVGVTDWSDSAYSSGLAVAGLAVGGIDVITNAPVVGGGGGSVPLPGSALLFLAGAIGLAFKRFAK
jgi:hypothetical protein